MWKHCGSFSLGLLVLALISAGQGGPSAQDGVNRPDRAVSQNGGSGSSQGLFESDTFLEMADRVFDPESDAMDFQNGSFNWKGKSFNLTEQRAFRSRFERYLLASPTREESRYAALMTDIRSRLSVEEAKTDDALLDTWQLLFRASAFELDGGNSTIIANQVFNAWRIRKESRSAALTQRELEDIRKYQQEVVANRAQMLDYLGRANRIRGARSGDEEENGAASEDEEGESDLPTEASFRALDLAETEAKLAALEADSVNTGIQAKLQFQSQIVSFLIQRRFEHALVLSGFYRSLFKGSHQELEVGRSQLEAFLPGSDLSYTVDSMAFIAREAINDVNKGIDAVNTAYDEGRMMLALERLQEVFFLGEYMTEVNRLSTRKRRHLLELYRGLIDASELADAKDYDSLATVAGKIAALAQDFPKTRVLSAIETAKSMSDMAVFAASQYRNLGQIDQARDELKQAIRIWPGNPSIRDFQQETTKMATAGSQGVQVFDDLYNRNDRRGIYERRMELGFALSDDAQRRPLLMEVVEEVARIDLLVRQSEELVKQGEAYAAWELLYEAAQIDPTDGPMNQARAELAPRVSEFVAKLDRAERLAKEGHAAGALAGYLAAQDVYPASRLCRVGILRESDALFEGLRQPEEELKEPVVNEASESTAESP
ncbi:MAG: hypothetical protein ACLFU4_06005 [Opitutales bacterium]